MTRQDRVETVEQILYGSTLPTRAAKAYAARIIEALKPDLVAMICEDCLVEYDSRPSEDDDYLHRP